MATEDDELHHCSMEERSSGRIFTYECATISGTTETEQGGRSTVM